MNPKSGKHLGTVRKWIQWNCQNGDSVTWGSDDVLNHQFTVRDLEEIAQHVREAVIEEQDTPSLWDEIDRRSMQDGLYKPLSEVNRCKYAPPGWVCSRKAGHHGPCAARRKDALQP